MLIPDLLGLMSGDYGKTIRKMAVEE